MYVTIYIETKKDIYCRLEFLNLLYQNNFDVLFCLNDIEIALHRVLDENTMESKMIQESLQKVSYGMKCENGVINFVNAVTTVAENMKEEEDKKNK